LAKLDQLKKEMKNTLSAEENFQKNLPVLKLASKTSTTKTSNVTENSVVFTSKIDKLRENIVGFNTRYISPFNIELETVYVDHTATNRPYRKVEDMIEYAKKFSANPHTEFSHFGSTL
jgi:hypothetical protein